MREKKIKDEDKEKERTKIHRERKINRKEDTEKIEIKIYRK